jgi:hypothetical protein
MTDSRSRLTFDDPRIAARSPSACGWLRCLGKWRVSCRARLPASGARPAVIENSLGMKFVPAPAGSS